ncbi:MAG: adenylate/guanylate cyclase domain-containing protein [Aphanocapsa sp. GSE-SYN-MK-11-07L]|jgi:adenylate cyclase|nr:adenylate/guanylate cyclase domain-containing protein [Aphanocapsa sp. GSE-SYN-MK-11-07L]
MPKRFSKLGIRLTDLGIVAITSVVVTGLIVGLRYLGGLQLLGGDFDGLQPLELAAYDLFVQMRTPLTADQRILVIGITEPDVQNRGSTCQFSDQVYADLIQQLLANKPRAIGLDIYRDQPVEPGHQAFVAQLKTSDRIFGITKLKEGKSASDQTIPPPPALPASQVGFNDVVVDRGGIIRRALLFQQAEQGNHPLTSFALQLALRYLQDDKIEPTASPTNPNNMQIGPAVFVPMQPNDGGYIKADVRGYQILLNYRGDNRSLRSIAQVSLGQVLSGKVEPALIRDRMILIGNVAESCKDFFYTPYSSGLRDDQRMAGVMIHAQMASQILDAATAKRSLFWFWSEPLEIVWIFLWALSGGLLASSFRHPLLLAASEGISLAALIGICYLTFLNSGWIPLVPPALALVATGGSIVTYNAQQSHRQQQMVMRLLGQSTSPEIAETLWQQRDQLLQDGKLAGQNRTATLLFTDLRNFSTISERYDDPKPLLEWLNEYLEEITQVVQSHHGVVNKFTGDGIMAVFGVPLLRTSPAEIAEDAQRAVACALAMGDRLQHLNQIWQQRGLQQVEMRAGIFTGPVVAGSLGGKSRLEYGVIGDSVNTASRLESLDKHRQPSPCRVLIAKETLDYLGDQFEVEPWGPLELKGKSKKIQVYRVIGAAKPDQTPSPKSASVNP